MKSKFAATTLVPLLGWVSLIMISVGSVIRDFSFCKFSVAGSCISDSFADSLQYISSVTENITGVVLKFSDTIFNFLYYDYCDFVLGLL